MLPLRDVLAGLFFVSVGMLIDPMFVAANLLLVLVMLGLIVLVKGSLTVAVAAAFGYPGRVSLLSGVSLAQSAEFSFLLASLGAELGAVSSTAFNVMLAGSAASIVLSPSLHRLGGPLARWVYRWPSDRASGTHLAPEEPGPGRHHAVICGYGRVGGLVGESLARRGLSFVVIEQEPRVVRRLRERGIAALLGSADNQLLLDRVDLKRARVLVVAVPDALVVRQVVDHARQINPDLDIVARTHSLAEMRTLRQHGVTEAVMGELELALEMTRHMLHRFGVTRAETTAIVDGLRDRAVVE